VSHDILERVTGPNLLSPLKVNKPGHRIRKWLMDPDGEAVDGQNQSKDQLFTPGTGIVLEAEEIRS
jgi:hypothetical protein